MVVIKLLNPYPARANVPVEFKRFNELRILGRSIPAQRHGVSSDTSGLDVGWFLRGD